MGLADELRKLRERLSGAERSILLEDGTTYRYRLDVARSALWRHGAESIQADFERRPRPAPPPILAALARARDRSASLRQLYPEFDRGAGPVGLQGVDVAALVERGELVPTAYADALQPVEDARGPARGPAPGAPGR